MPLLRERLAILREAGQVLYEVSASLQQVVFGILTLLQEYNCSVARLIESAEGSAATLVNILARDFCSFRDEHRVEGRRKPVRFLKRAQIFAADVWACFEGESYGGFRDIDKLTMFADYRVPQILSSMGCIFYSPQLTEAIRKGKIIESGSSWEVQIRGTSRCLPC
jgi:hypothetical protein